MIGGVIPWASKLVPLQYKIAAVALALGFTVVAIYGYGAWQYRAGRLDADLKWAQKIATVRAENMVKQAEAQAAIVEKEREHAAYIVETNGTLVAFRANMESGAYDEKDSPNPRRCVAVPKRMSIDLNAVGRSAGTRQGK